MAGKVAIEVVIKDIKKIADLKKGLKELRAEQKKQEARSKTGQKQSHANAKAYKARAKAIKENSTSLRELNKNMGASTKATKKITKSNNGMAKQFIKGAAAIAVIVGAFRLVSRVITSVVSTFTDFEFVMAKVNAVSGATEKEFAALTKTAEELGRTTFFTATQVGELMLNFSKLGFTANEIQDAVQPTLDLATATGSDLARAALVAGAAVRGFALDASETQRVVDVMAVAFSSSAMNIEKWQTSMTKVAPIAKAAGFSIEDTAAIMSKLTDSGIEASIAGTSLRNILLKMQDPTSDLSKAFGGTIHSLDDLVPAMKKFVAEGGSMADIMEVVDLRQAAAFEQMLTTADGTLVLRDSLRDASGEGARMAGIVGDTLQGAFLKFTSALQGLSISVMKDFAGGMQVIVEGLAKFMNILAKNSKVISGTIKVVIKLAKWFGIYKLTLMAVRIQQKFFTAELIAARIATIATSVASFTLGGALRFLKLAWQSLLGSTGVGLLVILFTEVATRMLIAKDSVDDLTESLGGLGDSVRKMTDDYHDSLKPIEKLKTTSEELIRVKGLMNKMIDDGLIVLDKEGKAVEGSAISLKTYNKYKGQAAILTRGLNTELKNNDQELITEKTSIEGVATAIDTLTTALTNQALVKGFERQIEKIAEVAANAEITKQKILADLDWEGSFDEAKIKRYYEYARTAAADMSKEQRATGKASLDIFNRIMEEGGFNNIDEMIKALTGSEQQIEVVTKAFENLGLDFSKMVKTFKGAPTTTPLICPAGQHEENGVCVPNVVVTPPKEKEFEALDSQFLAEEARGYWVTLMKDVLAGDMKMAAAEKDLYDYKIELMTNLLLDENLSYDAKMALEEKLIQLKLGNAQKEAEIAEAKKVSDKAAAVAAVAARQAAIDGMQEIGNQLIFIAGEEENLQHIKKLGIQISQAAAVATSIEAMATYGGAIADTALKSPWWMKIINVVGLIAAMASTMSTLKSLKNSFGDGGVVETFAGGGMVHGPSHAKGGVKFAVGGRVNELEGGEAVINKRSTAMFRDQLSSMNQAGGGVKFADGGLLNSPAFAQQQFSMGGKSSGSQKVYVVEADISNSQKSVNVLEAAATI